MLVFHSKHADNRVTVVGEFKDGSLCVSAARCSNKDNFSREKGREVAMRRYNVGRTICSIPVVEQTTKAFVIIAQKLADLISPDVKFKEHFKKGEYEVVEG